MGVGINSANQVVGALGAVGVASRMIGNQIDSDVSKAEHAKVEDIEAAGKQKSLENSEIPAAQVNLEEAEAAHDAAFKDLDSSLTKNGNPKKGISKKQMQEKQSAFRQSGYDMLKAKTALEELQQQQVTLGLLRAQYQKQIKQGARWKIGGNK